MMRLRDLSENQMFEQMTSQVYEEKSKVAKPEFPNKYFSPSKLSPEHWSIACS
jgi:hypothetical protein